MSEFCSVLNGTATPTDNSASEVELLNQYYQEFVLLFHLDWYIAYLS